jgi:hypothetical protein
MKIDENAVKLAKNPLGIIALFILLTYGMASLLFGFVNSTINDYQRWVFVIFIISFPVIVLCVFYILVTKYHTHLYSPGEFQDETNFVGINQSKKIGKKKEKERKLEVEEIIETEKNQNVGSGQNQNNKNIMAQYIKAERLALDKLAKERNAMIRRDVAINDRDIGFDGLLEDDKALTFVEVKYLRRNIVPFSVVETILSRAKYVLTVIDRRMKINKKIAFILIFVIDSVNVDFKFLQKKLNEYNEVLSNTSVETLIYKMDDLESQAQTIK